MTDFEAIRRDYPIPHVAASLLGVVWDRAKSTPTDLWACCPLHREKTPSFHVEEAKGLFYCHGCGKGGDVIKLVQESHKVDAPEAAAIITGEVKGAPAYQAPTTPPADPYKGYKYLPAPADAPAITAGKRTPPLRNPKRTDGKATHYTPEDVYPYYNADGALLGYVLRVVIEGKKLTPQIWWMTGPDGFEGWSHGSLPGKRPMDGLVDLLTNPGKQVLVVEGEKCRKAAAQALAASTWPAAQNVVVVSWMGGTKAIGKTDFGPLEGRNIILWPDNDLGGKVAMSFIADKAKAARVKKVKAYGSAGGDVADLIAAGGSVADYIKANISEWKGIEDGTSKNDGANSRDDLGVVHNVGHGKAGGNNRNDGNASTPSGTSRNSPERALNEPHPNDPINGERDPQPSAAPENNSPGTQSLGGVSREAVVEENADDLIQVPEGEDWRDYGVRTEEGKLKTTSIQNVQLCLQYDEKFKNTFAYNDFSKKIYVMRPPIWERMQSRGNWVIREVTEVDMTACQGQVEYECLSPKIGDIQRSIARVAEFNHFNPVKDRLRSLVWDGRPRLSGGKFGNENYSAWLTRYLGAANSEINAQFGRKWMISAVARALRPGCKVDTMIILEGPQGLLKSTALRILAQAVGDGLFTDNMTEPGSKDAVLQMQGKLIIEIAELEAFRRADVSTLKAFLSTQEDEVRRPYARMVETFKRSCVFAGTENPSDTGYLKDATGARRFWPVLCGELDIEYLKMDAVQLWAEAVVAFDAGEQWWLDRDSEDLARVEQAKRYKHDPWAAVMDDFLQGETQTTPLKIMKRLDLSGRDMNALANDRIVAHLKMMGWERKDINGSVKYVRPT